ncbi:MAG: transglutaminase domain-containing protein [Gammaproteobacteria bacterium]|nr:transglutaminase domain-containing protein [Gammaproteobacteria bacterium]
MAEQQEFAQYLIADEWFDYHHPSVAALAESIHLHDKSQLELAVEIYYLVRDEFEYNPYSFVDGRHSFKASFCVENNKGYCIPKSSLMIALCRSKGIPARIGLADVTNHLSTPCFLKLLRTDIFSMHAYVEVFLENKWIKATPVFNKALCDRMNSPCLEFDGVSDSLLQPFNNSGRKFMEYLKDWGAFSVLPVDFIIENLNKHYPHLMADFGKNYCE